MWDGLLHASVWAWRCCARAQTAAGRLLTSAFLLRLASRLFGGTGTLRLLATLLLLAAALLFGLTTTFGCQNLRLNELIDFGIERVVLLLLVGNGGLEFPLPLVELVDHALLFLLAGLKLGLLHLALFQQHVFGGACRGQFVALVAHGLFLLLEERPERTLVSRVGTDVAQALVHLSESGCGKDKHEFVVHKAVLVHVEDAAGIVALTDAEFLFESGQFLLLPADAVGEGVDLLLYAGHDALLVGDLSVEQL